MAEFKQGSFTGYCIQVHITPRRGIGGRGTGKVERDKGKAMSWKGKRREREREGWTWKGKGKVKWNELERRQGERKRRGI